MNMLQLHYFYYLKYIFEIKYTHIEDITISIDEQFCHKKSK